MYYTHARARDALDARRRVAALQRDLQMLTRVGGEDGRTSAGGSGVDNEGGACGESGTLAVAVAALTPEALRREVLSQHASLGALSEALATAEERVRSLERYADLTRLADDAAE